LTSERCIVPVYACVSPWSAGVRRHTRYAPTHVLAVTTTKLQPTEQQQQQQKGEDKEENEEEEEEEEETGESRYEEDLAVVWGERCGLQIWHSASDHDSLQPCCHISDEVGC